MRTGIIGGSFDPPHLGHLLVALQTKEIMNLDEIWLMPYFAHSWDSTVSSPQDRFRMTQLMQKNDIIASDEEIKIPTKSYTIETVRRLKEKHSHDFFWIIGSDTLSEFKKWKEYKQLMKEISFLVFPRNNYPLPKKVPTNFRAVLSPDLITSNISSTIIRNRLMKGLSVEELVPKPVLSYIQKRGLYRHEKVGF